MENKKILITGGNSGIGKAAATALAEMGAHVILVSRDAAKGEEARQEIILTSRNTRVDLLQCDLASLDSVRDLSDKIHKEYHQLDVLINNAGIYVDQRMETADGFEYQIGVNHLSHFLLTNLLIDLLRKSAPSRIINVSSAAHLGGKINFNDLHLRKGYNGWKSYAQAKLANVLFTYELAHRLTGSGITVNCLHPGVVGTRFAVNRKTGKPNPLMALAKPFMLTPAQGAETTVYLAASPEVEGVTGKYFVKRRQKASSRSSYDLVAAEKLWNISAELTKAG